MTDTYRGAGFRAPSIPSPARPGRPRKAASREQFLDAAVDLFGRQGVAATTLANIAKEVGVTSAMVHYHFANRDQLLDAVVSERILPFVVAIHDPIKLEALHDPAQVFREMAECMIEHVLRLPWLASTWLSDVGSTSGELCQRVMPHVPLDRVEQLTAATVAAQARGEFNPHLLPHMVFMSMAGLVLLPFASITTCCEVHPDADFSTDAMRRHVMSAVEKLLRP
jgi:TetR/AcrR family transcriptional regulator